jgi:hypothetical protein
MAEIHKLSVGKVLDKLRSADEPKTSKEQLDAQAETINEEIQRMRAVRLRLKRGPQGGATGG